MLGNFSCLCCRLLIFFSKLTFSKNSFRNTIKVSNSLYPDQDWHSVRPDLGQNSLQRLSADDKSPPARKNLISSSCSPFPIIRISVKCFANSCDTLYHRFTNVHLGNIVTFGLQSINDSLNRYTTKVKISKT